MQQSRAFVIVNPVASHGRVFKRWPVVRQYLQTLGLVFDSALTEAPLHATTLARDAAAEGYNPIVAYGGDGTLMEAVNGLLTEPGKPSVAALGIIPGGTGSDFVRTLGIRHDYKEACDRLLTGTEQLVDAGLMRFINFEGQEQELYFANVAGLGFDGEVVERVQASSKAVGGTLPYLTNLLITLVAYKNKTITLHFDGLTQQRRLNSVIVCNGRYFGGAMHIAPPADLKDGAFDLVLLGDLTKPELVANLPRVYKGTHLTHPKVDIYRAQQVRVDTAERMLVQADGELLGRAPATFWVIPSVLRVIA